jgi:hypothetical protein
MTTFDKREETFERKFALDEEQKFKAEQLGISGEAADAYAREVVAADFEPGGDGAFRKVLGDLTAKGVAMTEPQLRVKMDALAATAVMQIKAGT